MKRLGGFVAVACLLTACSSSAVSTSAAFPHTPAESGVVDTFIPDSASVASDTPQDFSTGSAAEIIYSIHSDGGILEVTYATASGQAQDTAVTGTDWAKTLPADGLTTPIVLAQNKGGGTITCTITYSDGTAPITQTSNGQFSIVTCNGG